MVELFGDLVRVHDLPFLGFYVPGTFLIADVDGALVGRVSVGRELNKFLANERGHIGYSVRPRYRRRGYATEILRQSLIVARAEAVDRLLVTCDDDNTASATIIERVGGVLEDVRDGSDGIPKRATGSAEECRILPFPVCWPGRALRRRTGRLIIGVGHTSRPCLRRTCITFMIAGLRPTIRPGSGRPH